jgi:predicted dehydrogenase
MLRIGIAGIGFMGWIHYLAYKASKGVKLSAICTRDAAKLAGDWRGIKGNFGPPGEEVDLSGVAKYRDLKGLLADPKIDVVDICLPPHLHCDAALQAFAAGKHVFCEKPMGLTTAECDKMLRAAEKAGRQLVIGHVLPFFPEFAYAYKVASGGKYGKLLGGTFKRVIADPLWLPDFYDPRLVGGPLVDLNVHDTHFIRLLFGRPSGVISQGRMRGEVVEYCNTQFRFADPALVVTAAGGVINQQGRGFTHGFEIHLEKATLHYEAAFFADAAEIMPLAVVTKKGEVLRPDLGQNTEITAFAAEIKEMAKSVSSGRPSPLLSGELARDAILLCHKQTEAVKSGRLVKV